MLTTQSLWCRSLLLIISKGSAISPSASYPRLKLAWQALSWLHLKILKSAEGIYFPFTPYVRFLKSILKFLKILKDSLRFLKAITMHSQNLRCNYISILTLLKKMHPRGATAYFLSNGAFAYFSGKYAVSPRRCNL